MRSPTAPDRPMQEADILRAEQMLRHCEISQSDFAWLMGLEDDESDRPPPSGFKSRRHFEAFLWHKERARQGLPKLKRRKRAS